MVSQTLGHGAARRKGKHLLSGCGHEEIQAQAALPRHVAHAVVLVLLLQLSLENQSVSTWELPTPVLEYGKTTASKSLPMTKVIAQRRRMLRSQRQNV